MSVNANISSGAATASSGSSSVALTASATQFLSGLGTTTCDYQITNSSSICRTDILHILNGANTITAPTNAAGVIIQPDPLNRYSMTLKGVAGDTGIAIHKNAPILLPFTANPIGTLSFVIDGGASNYSAQAVTADAPSDKITLAAHTLIAGSAVYLTGSPVPGGITSTLYYYVVNPTTNDFQLSLTKGGSVVDITSNGTTVLLTSAQEARFSWL